MRLDSSLAVAAAALALATPASAAAPLRIDMNGDGTPDVVTVSGKQLVVATGLRLITTPVRTADGSTPRLDGALHVHGGVLLLVRLRSTAAGVADAVYRLQGDVLQRLNVAGGVNGFVTAAGAGGFIDVDCGKAPGSVVQISAEARGMFWRETRMTYTLKQHGFMLSSVVHKTVSPTQIAHRQCALIRR